MDTKYKYKIDNNKLKNNKKSAEGLFEQKELEKQKNEQLKKKKLEELKTKEELEKKKKEQEKKDELKKKAKEKIDSLLNTLKFINVAKGKDINTEIERAVEEKGCEDISSIYNELLPSGNKTDTQKEPVLQIDPTESKKIEKLLAIISNMKTQGLQALDNLQNKGEYEEVTRLLLSDKVYDFVRISVNQSKNQDYPSYNDIMKDEKLITEANKYKKKTITNNKMKQKLEDTKERICNIINEYNEKKKQLKKKMVKNNIANNISTDKANFGNTFNKFSNTYDNDQKSKTIYNNGQMIMSGIQVGETGNSHYIPKKQGMKTEANEIVNFE